jgi:hypothetical protein
MTKRLWEGLNPMRVIVLVFVLFWTLELPSVAAQESDSSPLGTVTTLFADWNRGDLRAMSKLFVQEPSVTDVFPRFYWRGKNAFRNWMSDLDKSNTIEGFTDYDFEPGTPLTNDIEGARAIVILPVVIYLKQDGRPESFPGLVNIVLRQNRASWKIVAFTWTSTTN